MPAGETDVIIRIEGVSKYFDDFQALNDVSLDVALGQRVVICGPSGSGKSTLIRCINGLEQHQSGSIVVDQASMPPCRLQTRCRPFWRRNSVARSERMPWWQ